MIKLPRLPVNWDKQPQLFERYWNEAMNAIESSINELQALPIIEEAIAEAQVAINNAQIAANAANAAAMTAGIAAGAANTAAGAAQSSADSAARQASLNSSGTTGLTLSATDAGTSATITISSHTRVYGDGSSVSVTGGSLTGLSYSTAYYIYYDQPSRLGGTVTYATTTLASDAVQTGDRHLVGLITTPAAAGDAVEGDVVEPAGIGSIKYKQALE